MSTVKVRDGNPGRDHSAAQVLCCARAGRHIDVHLIRRNHHPDANIATLVIYAELKLKSLDRILQKPC